MMSEHTLIPRIAMTFSLPRVCSLLGIVLLGLAAPRLSAQSGAGTSARHRLPASTDTIAVTVETGGRTIPFATAYSSVRPVMRADRTVMELTYQWHGNDGSATADTLWSMRCRWLRSRIIVTMGCRMP
jgi:hypothetical protein